MSLRHLPFAEQRVSAEALQNDAPFHNEAYRINLSYFVLSSAILHLVSSLSTSGTFPGQYEYRTHSTFKRPHRPL